MVGNEVVPSGLDAGMVVVMAVRSRTLGIVPVQVTGTKVGTGTAETMVEVAVVRIVGAMFVGEVPEARVLSVENGLVEMSSEI